MRDLKAECLIKIRSSKSEIRNPKSQIQNLKSQIGIDVVYSTKYRYPFIREEVEEELYAYLGGICNRLDCPVIKIGGYYDHVHILCRLSQKLPLMKLAEEVKSHSSKWIKSKGEAYRNFYWQNGYGAFSVNPAQVNVVIRYIERQKEHHRKNTFQAEYRALLDRYHVEYDERYVWD